MAMLVSIITPLLVAFFVKYINERNVAHVFMEQKSALTIKIKPATLNKAELDKYLEAYDKAIEEIEKRKRIYKRIQLFWGTSLVQSSIVLTLTALLYWVLANIELFYDIGKNYQSPEFAKIFVFGVLLLFQLPILGYLLRERYRYIFNISKLKIEEMPSYNFNWIRDKENWKKYNKSIAIVSIVGTTLLNVTVFLLTLFINS